jgi:hypothetical protein
MGTTLTGTTPQDTYDSLIKVTDNGPLSGTAKYLSDGLGNDSVLALSTTAVGISETSPLGKLHVKTADTGVSSVSAVGNLLVLEDAENGLSILSSTAGAGYILFGDSADNDVAGIVYDHSANAMILNTNAAERLRITSAGNVGIGTSTPAEKLEIAADADPKIRFLDTGNLDAKVGIVGSTALGFEVNSAERARITSDGYLRLAGGGIQFNGDTAAANALDDYEEGTFTATITPATSGTITSGATFTTWTYTKIGRQVTINGVFVISSVASPVGANVVIGGLPFTIFNNNGAYGAYSAAYFTAATSTNSAVAGRHAINSTQLTLGVDASTVAASDEIYVTATYFV